MHGQQPQIENRISRLEEWRDGHSEEFDREREAWTRRDAEMDIRMRKIELQIAKATGVIVAAQVVAAVAVQMAFKLWH